MTLPVSNLVNVQVNLGTQAAVGRDFDNLLVLGDSNVITGLERIRQYTSLADIAQDFGTTAPEYLAAELYYGQSPQPTNMSVGRWLRTATAGLLQGSILNLAQSAIALFTQVTSGGFDVTIDGAVQTLTGLNFSTSLNLNGVASVITTALGGTGICTWNGLQFVITSATTGAGVEATGTIVLTGNPANSDTITVNGTLITFVTGTATGSQVHIGASAQITAANLNTFLANSVNTNIVQASYSIVAETITVTFNQVGTGGNAFTLAKSSANITISGGTLTGGTAPSSVSYATSPGSGTDVSLLLGLTAAVALPLVPGYAAETALSAYVALDAISTVWYGSMFAASTMPSDGDNEAIAGFVEADEVTRMFGVTIQNSGCLSSEIDSDLGSVLKELGYLQTFTQYSSTNPYAVASVFGRMFSVDFTAQNSTITVMYKQEPGVLPEDLESGEAAVLEAKRINVYASYNNDTQLIQYGTMAGPAYLDEIHGIDSMQNGLQTANFNVNYTSPTKVPQTDNGNNQYVNASGGVCQQYVDNGLGAPGTWDEEGFGQLIQGQYLKTGYYIYAPPVASQSQSDREARETPPIQIAFKFAGANQIVNLILNVNR